MRKPVKLSRLYLAINEGKIIAGAFNTGASVFVSLDFFAKRKTLTLSFLCFFSKNLAKWKIMC